MFVRQSAVRPRDAILGKEKEPALIVVGLKNTHHLPAPLPPKSLFIFRADSSLFLFIIQLLFVEHKQHPKRVQISRGNCTPEDRSGKFLRNPQATN